ncbi:GLIPR1-like protein 1 [Diadema antillarum]|uniref:GLIPR1-like protein 1 n=1 Tax=Diadema antillarum TaxID=105358 RepID=UPI003A8B4C2A
MDLPGTVPQAPLTSMLGMTPEAERQTERSRGDFETREGCKGLESLLPPRGDPRGNRLTPGEKMVFLSAHNEFRGIVSPEAANMVQLQWDDSLAQMAQQWADRCWYGHGNPDNISPYSWVGQNIWAGSGTGWDHYGMIENWYSEAEDYHFANHSCSGVCGHYTQIMWAETTHVGCAVAMCSTLENLDWSPATILVCNYGEGGNYVGKRPYVRGRSCSKCPSVHHICVNNLCGKISRLLQGGGRDTSLIILYLHVNHVKTAEENLKRLFLKILFVMAAKTDHRLTVKYGAKINRLPLVVNVEIFRL